MKLAYKYMMIFFNFLPTSNHLHPLQMENCDSYSRLVVDEDDNGKFRPERVKLFFRDENDTLLHPEGFEGLTLENPGIHSLIFTCFGGRCIFGWPPTFEDYIYLSIIFSSVISNPSLERPHLMDFHIMPFNFMNCI